VPTTEDQQPVTPEDLGRFADVAEVTLSRDGGLVAAAVSVPDLEANRYRRDVVVGRVDDDEPLRPVDPAGSARLPRWSPADDRLAFVVGSGEIRLAEPGAAATAPVVSGWPDPIEELRWSPDGGRLLFVVREPVDRAWHETPEDRRPPLRLTRLGYRQDGVGWTVGRPRQAYLVDVASGELRRVSTGGFDDAEFAWSADGRSVFFVSQRHEGADRNPVNDVFVQEIGGEARRLTGTNLQHGTPVPSPDGSRLALTTLDIEGFPAATHLAVLDLATGALTDLAAELDRDCHGGSIVWTDDDTVAVIVDDAGAMGVRAFDVRTPGSQRELVGGERRITALDARAGSVAVVTSGPVDPPAVAVLGPHGTERVRSAPSAALAAERRLRPPRHEAVQVADGVTVDAWLVVPGGDPGRFPLVVWLQGGGTQYGWQFSHELQLLVSAGHAVLYLNARGSAGYGTPWLRSVAGPRAAHPGSGWGTLDVADVATVVRATLAAHPELDPGRVGVMGGSYGGLLTTHLLAQTDLFRAGWAERGPYNLYSDAGTKDEAPWFFDAYLGASHLEDPGSYWQASPLRLAGGISAPLAIVHSEEDWRCSIGQAEELFMALKLLDREVEFVRFPGEGHELTRSGSPVHRLQRLEILLEWFGRWLTP
jgi:dipeptidyl aminopeptidase/acylaminoacyl peptidase